MKQPQLIIITISVITIGVHRQRNYLSEHRRREITACLNYFVFVSEQGLGTLKLMVAISGSSEGLAVAGPR